MLQTAYRWEIFYTRTSVGTFISRQEPGGISRALLQKMHGSSNLFLYLSSTHHENSAVKTYYTMMAVDKFVSSKIPVEEFRTLDNYIDDYCDIGVINADLIRRLRVDAKAIAAIKDKNRIPAGSRAVTVFDDNSDTYSTYSVKNMRYYLQMVISLVNRYEDIYFFYKPRVTSVFARDEELRSLYNTLVAHPRCRLILPDDPDHTAIDLMAASDLVLTVYTSSTLTEALAAGIKTVCYKPRDTFEDDFWEKIEAMPHVCAHDQAELETDLDYWLLADRIKEFAALIDNHVKPKIDGYCDGRALERLKNIL
jgi:polysaccharide biosynthesis PFTS motif protein